jgi:hypothetical protein
MKATATVGALILTLALVACQKSNVFVGTWKADENQSNGVANTLAVKKDGT